MTLIVRIKDIFGIDVMMTVLERYQRTKRPLPPELKQTQHPQRERYLSALTNIRCRMIHSQNYGIFDKFSTAYLNIINHGVSERIFTRRENDNLTSQLADASTSYLDNEK